MASYHRLLTIRRLFDDARLASPSPTSFYCTKTLIMLDVCVEHALYTIILDHGTPTVQNQFRGNNDLQWHDLWQHADAVALSLSSAYSLPRRQQLKSLHSARNQAQHHGISASLTDVQQFIEPTRQFLSAVFNTLFKVDFERFQLWDGLQHPQIKEWLHDCNNALIAQHPDLTIIGIRLLYDQIEGCLRRYYSRHGLRPRLEPPVIRDEHGLFRRFIHSLQTTITSLELNLLTVSLGVSVFDHHRFIRSGHDIRVREFEGGGLHISNRSTWNERPLADRLEEATFMLDFVARLALTLDTAYPDIFAHYHARDPFRQSDIYRRTLAAPDSRPPT